MAASPVYEDTLYLPAACLKDVPLRAAVDRGCSLTKLAFVAKTDNVEGEKIPFTCVTFRNEDFEGAIHYLKEHANLSTEKASPLHVTGVGGAQFQKKISDILNVETVFIDEFLTQARGVHFLVNNLDEESAFYQDPVPSSWSISPPSPMVEGMRAAFKQMTTFNNGEEGSKFPALYTIVGSAVTVNSLDKDGMCKRSGGNWLGGRPFLGLSRLLLGTSDFKDLAAMAERGDKSNVDTQVKELLDDDPNSPYGRLNTELPLLPFGKPIDRNLGLEGFNKDDVAASLVGLFSGVLAFHLLYVTRVHGLNTIYCGGSWFQSEAMRRSLFEQCNVFVAGALNVKFMRTGHTGAFGAMISSSEDKDKYMKR